MTRWWKGATAMLIDADKLLAFLDDKLIQADMYDFLSEDTRISTKHTLLALRESVRQMSEPEKAKQLRWIPADKEHPYTKHHAVLAVVKYPNGNRRVCFAFRTEDIGWVTLPMSYPLTPCIVTHWMPLPEFPEEEKP